MSTYNIVMTATDAGFTATLKRAQMELMLTTAKVNVMNTAMAALRTGTLVGAGSLAAMIMPALLASKAVGEFEATVRRAVTVGGGDWAGKFNSLSKELIQIAKNYGVAMGDLSTGVIEFAKAGFDYAETMEELILPTTKLATVHLTDFTTTAAVATYTWQLYGKTLVEQGWSTEKVFEKLNVAANETMLDIEELGHAIQYAGSNAVVAGMKYEEFLAVLGAMRQLAYSSDQTLGTLINRMLVSGSKLSKTGKTLESIIGAERGSIVKDGILNLTLLMQYLDKLPNKFEFTEWAAESWGVRSANVFNVLANVTEEYDRLLATLYEDTDTLNEQAETMKDSIPALMTRIINVFKEAAFAPEMMEKMAVSMKSLLDALEGGELGRALAGMLIQSFDFLAEQGPRLVSLIAEILMTVAEAMPYLADMAEFFVKIGRAVTTLGGPMMTFLGTLFLFNKVLPVSTVLSTTAALKMLYYASSKKYASEMTNQHTVAMANEITMMQTERIMIEMLNSTVRMRLRANVELIQSMMAVRQEVNLQQEMSGMASQMAMVEASAKKDLAMANMLLGVAIEQVAADMVNKGTMTEAEIMNDMRMINATENLAEARRRVLQVRSLELRFTQAKIASDWDEVDSIYQEVLALQGYTQAVNNATTANKINEQSELSLAKMRDVSAKQAMTNALSTARSAMLIQTAVTGAMATVAMSLMTLQSSAAGWVKAVGVIGAVASMVIPVLTHFAMVKTAAEIPYIGWALGIAGALAVGGMAASLYAMGQSQQAQVESQTSGYVSDVYSSEAGGYVKSEGWRYIHPGEYIVPQTGVANVDKHLQLRTEAEFAREERRDEQYRKTQESLMNLIGLSSYLAKKYGSQEGGYVVDEGWRYIHDGEYIIPKAIGDMAVVDETLALTGEGDVGPEGVSKARAVDYAFRFAPDEYVQMITPEFDPDPEELLEEYDGSAVDVYVNTKTVGFDEPVPMPVTIQNVEGGEFTMEVPTQEQIDQQGQGFWDGVAGWFTGGIGGLGINLGGMALEFGTGLLNGALDIAGRVGTGIIDFGGQMASFAGSAVSSLAGLAGQIAGGISSLASSLSSAAGDFISGAASFLGDVGSGASDVLGDVANWLGFQEGGYVPYTGWAFLHGGEYVVSQREAMEAETILRRRGIGASLRDVMSKRVRTQDKNLLAQTAPLFADLSYISSRTRREGGYISEGGWYYLHSGEYVAPEEAFNQTVYDLYERYLGEATLVGGRGALRHPGPRAREATAETLGLYDIYPDLIGEEAEAFLSRNAGVPPDMAAMIRDNPFLIYDSNFLNAMGLSMAEGPSGAFAYAESLQSYKQYKGMMSTAFQKMAWTKLSGEKGIWDVGVDVLQNVFDGLNVADEVLQEWSGKVGDWTTRALREFMYTSTPMLVRSGYTGGLPSMYQTYATGEQGHRSSNYYDYRNVNIYDAKRDEVYRAIREAGGVD